MDLARYVRVLSELGVPASENVCPAKGAELPSERRDQCFAVNLELVGLRDEGVRHITKKVAGFGLVAANLGVDGAEERESMRLLHIGSMTG